MNITCACGKRLVAGDHLAGKRTKCPHCGTVLTVPAASDQSRSEAAESTGVAGASAPESEYAISNRVWTAPSEAPPPAAEHEVYSLLPAAERALAAPLPSFDEQAANDCPECGRTLPENAVICVGCGLDLRSGTKLKAHSSDGARGKGRDGRSKRDRR
jgi:hypothetical protein